MQDRDGAKILLHKYTTSCTKKIQVIWGDAGYAGKLIGYIQSMFSIVLEIVRRPRASSCFTLLKRRWVVERTFGWFCHYRRLSKDYEGKTQSSENMIYIAMIQLMLKRLVAGKKRIVRS